MISQNFHIEAVISVSAISPYLRIMLISHTFCNGQAQAIAVIHGSGLIAPIKSLEQIIYVLRAYRLSLIIKNDDTDFVNELSDIEGINSAILVSYNGDYMG